MYINFLSKFFLKRFIAKQNQWKKNAHQTQEKVFRELIKQAKKTKFGKEHQFEHIRNYEDFKHQVPIRDYEKLAPYIEEIQKGETDILWPKKPLYLLKTSGTVSGNKYIPATKESIKHQVRGVRNLLLNHLYNTKDEKLLKGKMLFLSGSPYIDPSENIPVGRLSGIVHHHIPFYLKRKSLPDYETNCIKDWEDKMSTIIQKTLGENITLLGGIPPWVKMYLDMIHHQTGKFIKDVFPNLSLFVHGGVNFAPYEEGFLKILGTNQINMLEVYTASEGFIGLQDTPEPKKGLLLQLNHGIFFEFIPLEEYHKGNYIRQSIREVKENIPYAIILNTDAGLWGYELGDVVRFTSLEPYRIEVIGRTHHYISAFGEHVISSEVEEAIRFALESHPEVIIQEFLVAPYFHQNYQHKSCYEWFVEFITPPKSLEKFSHSINQALRTYNSYYNDLIKGKMLTPPKITSLRKGAFKDYFAKQNKLGGQHKVPRLTNHRKMAKELGEYIL